MSFVAIDLFDEISNSLPVNEKMYLHQIYSAQIWCKFVQNEE